MMEFFSITMFTEAGLVSILALILVGTAVLSTRALSKPFKAHEIVITASAWLGTVFVGALAAFLWVLAIAPVPGK